MNIEIKNSIFRNLPIEIVNNILSLYYGPLDLIVYQRQKIINENINKSSSDIILNLIEDYTQVPELEISNGDLWYDYTGCIRLPRLEPV